MKTSRKISQAVPPSTNATIIPIDAYLTSAACTRADEIVLDEAKDQSDKPVDPRVAHLIRKMYRGKSAAQLAYFSRKTIAFPYPGSLL